MFMYIYYILPAIVCFGLTWFCSASLWIKDQEWKGMMVVGLVPAFLFFLMSLAFAAYYAGELKLPWYYGSGAGLVLIIIVPILYCKIRDWKRQ